MISVSTTVQGYLVIGGIVFLFFGMVGWIIWPHILSQALPASVRFGLIGAGVALVVGGLKIPNDATTTTTTTTEHPVSASGRIGTPQAGRVQQNITAQGTASGLTRGDTLWLIVEIGRFYPQPGPLPIVGGDRWSGPVPFGQDNDTNTTFALHLVLATADGNAVLADYIRRGESTGEFPGIARSGLPQDIRYLDSVTVTRQ